MRKIKTKIITLLAAMSVFIACMAPMGVEAVTLSKIEGVNYGRIYMNVREYDVTAKVGGYLFPGKITRTANFDETELNKYISIFMENNHVTSKQLADAEFTIQDAIRETGYQSRQIIGDMAQTIAGVLGGEMGELTAASIRGYIENAIYFSDAFKNVGDVKALFTLDNLEQFFKNQYQYVADKYVSVYGAL